MLWMQCWAYGFFCSLCLKRIFSTDRFPSIHCSYNLGQFKRSSTKEIQIISEFKRLTKENASTNCQNNSHQIRLPVWFLIWLQSRSSTKRRSGYSYDHPSWHSISVHSRHVSMISMIWRRMTNKTFKRTWNLRDNSLFIQISFLHVLTTDEEQ